MYRLAAALLFGVGFWFKDDIKEWFEEPKKIQILGEQSVGKTTFINYLKGKYEKEAIVTSQTLTSEKEELKIGKTKCVVIDNPGSKDYHIWKKTIKDGVDYLLYFFNASAVAINESATIYRIKDDMKAIGNWLEEKEEASSIKKIFLIGTHTDIILNYNSKKFIQNLTSKEIYRIMMVNLGGVDKVDLILGSLKTKKGFDEILNELIKKIDNEK